MCYKNVEIYILKPIKRIKNRKIMMKKTVLVSAVVLITLSSFGQLVRPNRPVKLLSDDAGYITINEFRVGYGLGGHSTPYSMGYVGITSLHAYQVNETFLVGAGTGLLFYNDGLLVPLYIDMRLRFLQKTVSPYASAEGGLLLNPSDFNAGTRMYINPSGGVILSISRNFAANIGLGLHMQMGPNISRASFFNGKIGVTYKF